MKKILLLLAVLLLNLNHLYSQSKQGIVHYGQLESMGMGGPVGVDYNAVLTFDQNESLYTTRKDSLEEKHVNELVALGKNSDSPVRLTKATNERGFLYYQTKDSLYSRDLGFTYVKEPLPKIDWKLENKTKKIGGLLAKKATAHFRGRDYTAWYTTAIPLPYGPWKLHGLPGLILEAYDENKEVYFYFKSVTYPAKQHLPIHKPKLPKNKEWLDFPEYKAFLVEAFNDAIFSGRMVLESANIRQRGGENKMKKIYIEAFY